MDLSADSGSADEGVLVPFNILSTCHGQHRRSYNPRVPPETGRGGRRVVSMITATTGSPNQQDQVPTALSSDRSEITITSEKPEDSSLKHCPISHSDRPQPATIDFAELVEKNNIQTNTEKQNTTLTTNPDSSEDTVAELETANRSSVIFKRLSHVARSFVGSHLDRQSESSDGHSSSNRFSAFFHRLSYISHDSKDEEHLSRKQKRQSKAIPKSWRFLGVDSPTVGDAVFNVKSKLRTSNFNDMYEKAKIKQEKIRRSKIAQSIFRYTFYVLLVATVYLLLVGLPLWRGLVWYLYILFQKHLVLKAGLTITFGIGFL